MTVKELIQLLEKEPPNMTVVTDLHSEYAPIEGVFKIEGFDNGGYVSAPRYATEATKLSVHGYVYVGVRDVQAHARYDWLTQV